MGPSASAEPAELKVTVSGAEPVRTSAAATAVGLWFAVPVSGGVQAPITSAVAPMTANRLTRRRLADLVLCPPEWLMVPLVPVLMVSPQCRSPADGRVPARLPARCGTCRRSFGAGSAG